MHVSKYSILKSPRATKIPTWRKGPPREQTPVRGSLGLGGSQELLGSALPFISWEGGSGRLCRASPGAFLEAHEPYHTDDVSQARVTENLIP